MNPLTLAAGGVIVGFVELAGLAILYQIFTNQISLKFLIADESGDASMSRFQLLVFTFVIALSLFLVTVGGERPAFPDNIPPEILTLLGISASSFLVSKGINVANPATISTPTLVISPTTAGPLAAGATQTFTVSQLNVPDNSPMPAVVWSLDAPAEGNLSSSGNTAVYTAPAALPAGGLKVTVRVTGPGGFTAGTAIVT